MKRKDRVLAAISGGPDSIALLHILHSSSKELGITLRAAHLNHMIRGRDALLDQRAVVSFCKKHSIPLSVKSINVPAMARSQKISLEDAGRRARYEFLEETADRVGASKIAFGHTADDNVETVLMRLVTGAGMRGLLGIPARRGRIVRPLIDSWRSEIEEYCRAHNLKPRIDKSNYDAKYLRNRVRHKLIPLLKTFNPNFKGAIKQMSDTMSADYEYLIGISEKALHGATKKTSRGSISLDIDKLLTYPDSIRRLVLRLAIEGVKGDLENLTLSHVEDISKKLLDNKRWELHLPDGVFALGNGDELEIRSNAPKVAHKLNFKYKMPIPGSITIREAGVKIKAELASKMSHLKLKLKDKNCALLDVGKIGSEVVVRSRGEGDRFSPFGFSGTKKLKDYLIDEKVPAEKRDLVPIVESGGRIAWVAGMRIDDRFKVTKDTKKVVRLRLI